MTKKYILAALSIGCCFSSSPEGEHPAALDLPALLQQIRVIQPGDSSTGTSFGASSTRSLDSSGLQEHARDVDFERYFDDLFRAPGEGQADRQSPGEGQAELLDGSPEWNPQSVRRGTEWRLEQDEQVESGWNPLSPVRILEFNQLSGTAEVTVASAAIATLMPAQQLQSPTGNQKQSPTGKRAKRGTRLTLKPEAPQTPQPQTPQAATPPVKSAQKRVLPPSLLSLGLGESQEIQNQLFAAHTAGYGNDEYEALLKIDLEEIQNPVLASTIRRLIAHLT